MTTKIYEFDKQLVKHPYYIPDIFCVADLGVWMTNKIAFVGPKPGLDWTQLAHAYGPKGSSTYSYVSSIIKSQDQSENFTPIGAFLTSLMHKLAWGYPALRPLSKYFSQSNLGGSGEGLMKKWDRLIFSDHIRSRIEKSQFQNEEWNEWSMMYL